jgi:hypothetical protein
MFIFLLSQMLKRNLFLNYNIIGSRSDSRTRTINNFHPEYLLPLQINFCEGFLLHFYLKFYIGFCTVCFILKNSVSKYKPTLSVTVPATLHLCDQRPHNILTDKRTPCGNGFLYYSCGFLR